MNYYTTMGGDPQGNGQRRFVIFDDLDREERRQQQAPPIQIPQNMQHDFLAVQLSQNQAHARQGHAQARQMEVKIILDGMSEIRQALQAFQIADGDKGGDGRPPVESGFDEINIGKLQQVYLSMSEKYLNYVTHALGTQLAIPLTNHAKQNIDGQSLQK